LPPVRLSGLDGRVWTSADFEGKVAVMNVWATWCAPCIAEFPHFQKLHDQLKDKPNVVVVTLNIDANPGVVAPFMKNRGHTFPILLAHEYVGQLQPDASIPRNWIVKGGEIRSEQIRFNDPERWLKEMLAKVDEALASK
jgi:thiol-disulfide isomerase/thioredoxin